MYPTSSSSIEIGSQSVFVPGVIEKNSSIVEIYFNSPPLSPFFFFAKVQADYKELNWDQKTVMKTYTVFRPRGNR